MLERLKFFLDKNQRLKKILLFFYKKTIGAYSFYKENKNFKQYNERTLQSLDKVFKELKCDYWLDFGTLLGAVRENNFIEHDCDIDVGMWLTDYSIQLHSVFEKYGFKKIRDIKVDNGKYGLELTYQINNINVDIFFYTRIDDKCAYYHDFIPENGMSRIGTIQKLGGLVVREISLPISSIGSISFKNANYPIPEPVIDHLIGRYGEGYKVKDSNWSITKGNQDSVKILSDKIGVISYY